MAGIIVTPTSVITETPVEHKAQIAKPNEAGEPLLDDLGNVITSTKPQEQKVERRFYGTPLERARQAARLDKPTPTAGQYGIEHGKGPTEIEIPPECYLYDEDRPWVLGKLNPAALDVPEPADPVPLSKETLEYLDNLEAAACARMKAELESRSYAEEVHDQAIDENYNKAALKDGGSDQTCAQD